MSEPVKKEEAEALLGFGITDEQFNEALEHAKRKQEYIYSRNRRPEVLRHGYLVKLTEEYLKSFALSKLTMDLCGILCDMEKEHPAKLPERPTDNHIVSVSAL